MKKLAALFALALAPALVSAPALARVSAPVIVQVPAPAPIPAPVAPAPESGDELSAQLIETLIVNSARVRFNGLNNKNWTMASLFAEAFAHQTLKPRGSGVIITNVVSHCNLYNVINGVSTYDCQLILGDGDYEVVTSGYRGPELESAWILHFQTTKRNGGKHQLEGTRVNVDLAG